MPPDTEVGLGPGHIVLDGDPAAPKGHSPQFSAHVCCGQTAGWIKMPLGTVVAQVTSWGPSFPPKERGTVAPTFRLKSIVAKRSQISATAELLCNFV